jgi:hypothetical protein
MINLADFVMHNPVMQGIYDEKMILLPQNG